ncbi:MAG: thiosulfohydrolase SoxB, partial [Alphaproteobacteria bacterium]
MISRREFAQLMVAAASTTAGIGAGSLVKAAAHQNLTQDSLLEFDAIGQVTLMHLTDIHGQLMPLYFREPSINIGVGSNVGLPPHVTGKDFLKMFDIQAGSELAYALCSEDFSALAQTYGKIGGIDRIATIMKAVKAERGDDKVLMLDGGDTWQGSYTSLKSNGMDMVEVMNQLGVEAMTGHWEFTLGEDRVLELADEFNGEFLANNIRDTEWDESVFEGISYFEKGGVNVAVIGQAFPYTPIANPRWMIPNWSFGIQEKLVAASVEEARANGAEVVVMLSHNGFDVDRKLASRVDGIDVILTGHTHDALPSMVKVNNTHLVATGSSGKFVARIDLDVRDGALKDIRHKIIPIFSDVITPDADMATLVKSIRAPHEAILNEELGTAQSTLYRRGNLNGTFDDLICNALIDQLDAEIALSPGFRWGPSVLPGQAITREDIYNQTAMSYPSTYRTKMTGERIKTILEDVGDNLFNPDPYFQQGGDMVRLGGVGTRIHPNEVMGNRIQDLRLLKSGELIEDSKEYVVAGWASVAPDAEGTPIFDVVENHIKA